MGGVTFTQREQTRIQILNSVIAGQVPVLLTPAKAPDLHRVVVVLADGVLDEAVPLDRGLRYGKSFLD